MAETIDATRREEFDADRPGLLDLHGIWQHRRLIAGCAVLSLVAGVAFLLVATPTYEAKARVLIQQDGLSFDRPDRSPLNKEFLATQAEIIRSPLTVARALNSVEVTMPANDPRDRVTFVLDSLKVVPKVETDIVSIEYRSSVQGETARVIDAIIESYRQVVKETSRGDFTNSLEVLQQAEVKIRADLESLQKKYMHLREGSSIVGRGRDVGGVDATRIQELSKRLSDARARRIVLEERQKQVVELAQRSVMETSAKMEDGNGGATTAVESSLMQLLREEKVEAANDLAEVQRQVALAETRLQEVSRSYGPRHPDYRSAESQLSAWQEICRMRLAVLGDVLKQEWRLAKAAEDELERLYGNERREIKQMDSLLTEEQILLSNITRIERLHDASLQRLGEFRLADAALKGGRTTVQLRVVEGPSLNEKLIWPARKSILGACLILGSVIGMLIASARAMPRQRHAASAE